jgi:ribosome-binding protein aMBF1 (putative translation factor)
MNHKPTKLVCDLCGDPIAESLVMIDGSLRYNYLVCIHCADMEDVNQDQLEYEEDYDQPYDD